MTISRTKICRICGIEKNLDNFHKRKGSKDGLRNNCTECHKKYLKKYYTLNKNKFKNRQKLNKQKIKKQRAFFYKKNKEKLLQIHKDWCVINKEKIVNYNKHYRDINKEKIKTLKRNNDLKRIKTDLLYKISRNIRALIRMSFKNKGFTKKSKTFIILCCTFEELKQYLFSNAKLRYPDFKEEDFMKKKKYQIHHKVFLETAKTEEDIIRLNHYINLELLTIEDHKAIHNNKLVMNI